MGGLVGGLMGGLVDGWVGRWVSGWNRNKVWLDELSWGEWLDGGGAERGRLERWLGWDLRWLEWKLRK